MYYTVMLFHIISPTFVNVYFCVCWALDLAYYDVALAALNKDCNYLVLTYLYILIT